MGEKAGPQVAVAPDAAQRHSPAATERPRVLIAVLVVTAVAALVAATVGFVMAFRAKHSAEQDLRQATSLRLVAEAQSILARTRPGSDVTAFKDWLPPRNSRKRPTTVRCAAHWKTIRGS